MLYFNVIAAAALLGVSSGQSTTWSSTTRLSSAVSTTPQATASPVPAPQNFTIATFTFAGRGCPYQTAGLNPDSDLSIRTGVNSRPSVSLLHLYHIQALDSVANRGQRINIDLYGGHFNVSIGPGTDVSNHSSNCQFQLELDYDGSLQFALSGVETHGYAELGSGVSASFSYTSNFSDDSAARHGYGTVLSGGGVWAQGQAFTKGDPLPSSSYVWSPCKSGTTFNAEISVSLRASGANASAAAGDVGVDDAGLELAWRLCSS